MTSNTTPSTLKLSPVLPADIPALTTVWFAAFTDPAIRQLFPDTPGVRWWLTAANQHDLHSKPFQKYVKIVDSSARDEHGQEHERIIGYAKWDLSTPEERGSRYPLWHHDMPAAECEVFFEREDRERRRVMEGLEHYYLDTLVVHPDYQRRGAGSMLVQWGCDLADEEGVALYVDASRAGAPLYERFGFVDESEGDSGRREVASMIRRARKH
ncbi:GNAT family N-acetyltransferase [Aspergillus foveolatus]|uniref:GNAT family N-acetyltransferase n=1 Tax=Aspergillus foveolatus TaxID=210207 RepID=UPI003CCC90BD